jgi:hypothetical protein
MSQRRVGICGGNVNTIVAVLTSVIDDVEKFYFCQRWISNQIHSTPLFPVSDCGVISESKMAFEKIPWTDFRALNEWAEKYLKTSHWRKMKGALRARKCKDKKGYGAMKKIDLTHDAHMVLRDLAKHHKKTLSEVIRLYMLKAWQELPKDYD